MPRFTRLSDSGRDMNASTNIAKPQPLGHNSGPHSQAGGTKVPPYFNMFQDPGNKDQGWAPPVDFPTPGNSKGIHCLTVAAGIAGVTVWQPINCVGGPCKCPTWQTHEDLNTKRHHHYGLNNLQTDFYLFIFSPSVLVPGESDV